ncbi:MAG: glycosyltransferase family 1 protein, partial [Actinomycetota bacterium]|nr:glycosyltransferase family 1 protein [Actinomycetota bacterium]
MRRHLLVTNDFPPKVGGIQNYLWELWRRLEPSTTSVYCTPHRAAGPFDLDQPFTVRRAREPWLVPYPWLVGRIRRLAAADDAQLVLLDPALPLGLVGLFLGVPYGVILHGAEVTIPARLPVVRSIMARVLRGASVVVSAGDYALAEAQRCAGTALPGVVIPPGV